MTGRSSNKTLAFLVALLTLMALVVPLVGTANASHLLTQCLDVDPETDTNRVGETHEVTATLRSKVPLPPGDPAADDACQGAPAPAPTGGVNVDFRIEGPNDPNPLSPFADYECEIPAGASTCSFIYGGTRTGTDLIRGWVDHDRTQTSVEADNAEGRNDILTPGAGDHCTLGAPLEPDCTDVVSKTWNPGPVARVDCDDSGPPNSEREVNPSREGSASDEVYTCRVTDAQGNPVHGARVHGENESGINDPDPEDGASYGSPDYGCTTPSSTSSASENPETAGRCQVVVTQSEGEEGTAEICFWNEPEPNAGEPREGVGPSGERQCADEPTEEAQASDGSDTGNDGADQVEKTWEERRASAIDAEPESDTNNPGEPHTITATVYDQFGQPFDGNTNVGFEFFQGSPSDADLNTPASPDRSCTTNNSSSCSVTYTSARPGTDRVCVYPTSSQPDMQGDNTNGTCDGESLSDPDDDPAGPDAPERDANDRVSDDQDVVQKHWAAPGEARGLDCTPETDNNPTGTSHTITCTARDQQGNVMSGVNVDAEATGANDPDNSNSPTSPDFSCQTGADGTCSFTHGGTGGTGTTANSGTTTYRAWIDRDNNNATSEADETEARDETTATGAGNEAEPDNTDVVAKTWQGPARTIDCSPNTATNSTGTQHVVTCLVRDAAGTPVQGERVTFSESGPGTITPTQTTTDQNGHARTTATSNEAGTQTITGRITASTETEPDVDECNRAANDPQGAPQGECADTVTKTWVAGDGGASRARTIDCSPNTASNATGTQHVVTCVVRDASNQPVQGERVTFTESGPGSVSPTQTTTDQNGLARTTATSSQAGTQTITGRLTVDLEGEGEGGEGAVDECNRAANDPQGAPQGQCADTVSKTWVADGATGGPGPSGGACAGFPFGSRTPKPDGSGFVIVGTRDGEILVGTRGDDTICALGGDDQIDALGGNDQVFGGAGSDEIDGGAGRDQLSGQGGNDTISGRAGNDTVVGGEGNDVLKGNRGIDGLRGGGGRDLLQGGSGEDSLYGGGGDDILRGWTNDDVLYGGAGNDSLNGHRGRDVCRGGPGRDSIRNCERSARNQRQ